MKKIISIMLAVLMSLALCACGSKNDGKAVGNTNQTNFSALYDYAKRLESAGNSEAAAAVYALLPQGGGAELIEKAHDEFPVLSAADELGQFEAVFSHLKGGDGK